MNRIKLNHLLVVAVVPLALSGAGCSEQARLQNLTQDLSPCDDGSEMPSKYFCDKIADCRDGSDEAYCYDFECGGGDSTGYASRCDGYEDCSNGRDEEDCYRAPYFEAGDANNGNTNNGSGPSNNTFEDPGNNDFEPRPGEIGSACEYSGDCPGVCLTSQDRGIQDRFANGYCSASCGGDYDCPSGAHCSSEGMCVDSCDSDDACRDVGYICRDHDRDGRPFSGRRRGGGRLTAGSGQGGHRHRRTLRHRTLGGAVPVRRHGRRPGLREVLRQAAPRSRHRATAAQRHAGEP